MLFPSFLFGCKFLVYCLDQGLPRTVLTLTSLSAFQAADGGLGDDFLLSWKPTKINTTAKFDIDDGLQPVPYKKLKMPDDL